jgi:hypothetical protein
LREAKAWFTNHLRLLAANVYSATRWIVTIGGRTLGGAGKLVTNGWLFGNDVLGPGHVAMSNERFEAIEPRLLELSVVSSQRGFGFGQDVLSQQEALLAARALVKYDLPSARVRPLLVNSLSPKANEVLCVVGGHLDKGSTAVIELTGPEYRGWHLIRTESGVGGGCLRLPGHMAPGRWIVGVVDYGARGSSPGALVDAFPFTERADRRSRVAATTGTLIGFGIAVMLLLIPAAGLGPTRVQRAALALLMAVIGAGLITLGVELQDHSAQAVVLTMAGAVALFATPALLSRRVPLILGTRLPTRRGRPHSGGGRLGVLMGTRGWSTTNLVVVSLGVALAVFFAGVTAAIAAGQMPSTAAWAAGSAVSGALIGLLVPAPRTRKGHLVAAEAAEALQEKANMEVADHVAQAEAAAGDTAVEHTAKAEVAQTAAEYAASEVIAHKAAAAGIAGTTLASVLLLIVFFVLLILAVVLATGTIEPPSAFIESQKNITTAVIALASASGSALIGILAPSSGKGT